ncbi:MAG: hypothetical protein EOO28_08360 [Comamonadaceae bacterium]|nr:MAG: hypothetical protein EOO28_08360 [Comamonadaceae bacterium]
MAAQNLIIKFHDTQSNVKAFEAVAGGVNRFAVPADVHVELVDAATGKGPAKVSVKRKGNDLVVKVGDDAEGGDAVEVTLEGYYPQVNCQLLGLDSEGRYVEYQPTSSEGADGPQSLALLVDGESFGAALAGGAVDITVMPAACMVPLSGLGAEAFGVAGIGELGLSPLALGAIGLGGVAAVAAITGGGSGGGGAGGGGAGGRPAAPVAAPAGYADNVGAVQSAASTAKFTDDTTPGLNIGALPAGATGAVLYVNGVATAAIYDAGKGTLTPAVPLKEGTYQLGYGWSNEAGASESGPVLTLTVDTTAPGAAGLIRIVDTDGDGKPNVSGTGEPGAKVTVTDPAGGTHTATVDASGNFNFEIEAPKPGEGTYEVVITDPAENVGPVVKVVVLDVTAPKAPLLRVADTDGDGKPDISGTGEPGAKVTLVDPSGVSHTATVDASGNFNFEIDLPARPNGEYVATLTDPTGNTSLPTTVTVKDLIAPPAPVLHVADTDGDGKPNISGTGEPGAKVTVTDPAGGTHTATVDASGNFNFEIAAPSPLTGPYVAVVTDPEGNVSLPTKLTVTDLTAPTTPTLQVTDPDGDGKPNISGTGEPGAKVTVPTLPNPLTGTYKATATDASGNVSLPKSALFNDLTAPTAPTLLVADTDADGMPNVHGTAEAGSTVTIKDPSGGVHTTIALPDGTYSLEIPMPATPLGTYTATATDASFNRSAVTSLLVTDLTPPAAPSLKVVDTDADGLPNVSGTAEPNSHVTITDPSGGKHTVPVDANGNYNLEINPAPASTLGTYTAVAIDGSGNTSLPTTYAVTDSTSPVLVIIDNAPGVANGTVVFTFTFSEAVSGFNANLVTVSGGTKGVFTAVSSTVYTLEMVPPALTNTGTMTVNVGTGVVTDGSGNGNAGANAAQAFDTLPPTLVITDNAGGTSRDPVTFTFTFSETVTGFDASDISISAGTKGTFTAVSGSVYTLVVTPPALGEGNITLNVGAGAVRDVANNTNEVPLQVIQPYDTLPPVLTISDNVAGTASCNAGGRKPDGAGGCDVYRKKFSGQWRTCRNAVCTGSEP